MELNHVETAYSDNIIPLLVETLRIPWGDMTQFTRQWISFYMGANLRLGWGMTPLPVDQAVVALTKVSLSMSAADRQFLDQYQTIDVCRVQESFQRTNIMSSWPLYDHFGVAYSIIRSHAFRRVIVKKSSFESLCLAMTHQNAMLHKYGTQRRCRVCNARIVQHCFICSHRQLIEEEDDTSRKSVVKKSLLKETMVQREIPTTTYDTEASEETAFARFSFNDLVQARDTAQQNPRPPTPTRRGRNS